MSQGNPTQHEIDIYCAEWILNGGDQSKAWRKAYPESEAMDKVVWEKASRMNRMSKVKTRMAELQAEQGEKDAVEFDMSVSELKEKLSKVIECGLEKDDYGKYAGLGAVTSAVAEFNRMSGNHAPTKQDLTIVDKTPEQRKSRIAELLNKCGARKRLFSRQKDY